MLRFATASVAIIASAGSALATGSANIVNNCNFDVHVQSVSDQPGPLTKINANGGTYSEPFQVNPNGGGISLKVSKDGGDDVCQFEYTLTPPPSQWAGIFYDLSLINGNIFQNNEVAIVPKILSGDAGGSCNTVKCPAGSGSCKDAYNQPWDNHATHQCPADTDLTYHLCGDGSGSSSGGSSSSSSPAPAAPSQQAPQSSPSPAPQTTPSPTPTPQPAPAPAPSSSAAPASSPAPAPAPAPAAPVPVAAPAPAGPSSKPFVLSWNEDDGVLKEIQALKKRDHVGHIERHNRIRRMHHARSME